MKRTILLTGGLGYIGSHTIIKLLENNYNVIVVDNLSNSFESVIKNIEEISGKKIVFINCDISDNSKSDLDNIFENYKIYAIIHFAAFKSVSQSILNPLLYYSNNILGTINLLNKMRKHKIDKLVFSSSCVVYGEPEKYPVTEQTPLGKSKNVYGETKQMCEKILSDVCMDMSVVSLRYFNPIGAHESGLIFENPKTSTENLMPHVVEAIKNGVRLSIFGNDYDTQDGTAIRDYIDINDLADAHVKSLDIIGENSKGIQFINVGSGNGYSVMEIINCFKELGYNVPYKICPRRKGDVGKIYADISLAKEKLGWVPQKNLKDSLQSLIKAYKI